MLGGYKGCIDKHLELPASLPAIRDVLTGALPIASDDGGRGDAGVMMMLAMWMRFHRQHEDYVPNEHMYCDFDVLIL